MSKKIKMEKIKSPILAQDNLLTQSRYDFTVIEKRAVYYIIREVRKQFVERADGQKTLFDDLVVRLKMENMIGGFSSHKDVYKSLIKLRKKTILFEDEERIFEVGYINYFEHMKRGSEIEIQVSKKILPFLVELSRNFTEYYLVVAISLKNKYSQRFYEYCSQFKNVGYFYMTIEELRAKLQLGEKYSRYALLKSYVLTPAKKELKTMFDEGQCDLHFTYSEEKSGRSVKALRFKIFVKKDDSKTLKPLDHEYYIRSWLASWLAVDKKPKNKQWVDDVMSQLRIDPDKLEKLYLRLEKLQKEKDFSHLAAMARHIIIEDFI